MGELTAEQVAQRAIDLNLVDDRQLQSVWGDLGSDNVPPETLIQQFLRRELMTDYQVTKLLKGDRTGFYYGKYKVMYLVSAGTFARVYRAVEPKTGKVVAVKVLRKHFSDDKKNTEQFRQEGELGRTLRHENIVPIFEVHSEGRTHYLVMEFVEGGNLREFLKIRKRVEPAEATRLMIEATSGINYAHLRGLLHRDLKLTNILVSSRGQAKLVDFGLAGGIEGVSDDTESVENDRTIDYAGLERATGVRKDDPRSDIYFLGCIYYHLLTGKAPLQETRERIQRLAKSRYVDVVRIHRVDPEMPRVVSMVVNKAMELDADRRYQTPAQMLIDLNIAAKRLADGTDIPSAAEDGRASSAPQEDDVTEEERKRWAMALLPQSQRRALMFIESNPRMQDIFRDGLKRCGYRVLLTSDPQRALARFEEDAKTADCVVFSSGDLGESAVEAFNSFGESEKTKQLPAILLLGENQKAWKKQANRAQHRLVLMMPIKLRQLRTVLTELVPPVPNA